jgi:hypothetical protein
MSDIIVYFENMIFYKVKRRRKKKKKKKDIKLEFKKGGGK